ncbi:hypothetical protein H2202_000292 [Exophiala xenobiotica]|nr:hypothetical protein H2202_000292 [Exophiala xenobiotica]
MDVGLLADIIRFPFHISSIFVNPTSVATPAGHPSIDSALDPVGNHTLNERISQAYARQAKLNPPFNITVSLLGHAIIIAFIAGACWYLRRFLRYLASSEEEAEEEIARGRYAAGRQARQVDLVDIDEDMLVLDEADREEDKQATAAGDPLIDRRRTNMGIRNEKDAASADDLGIMQAKNPNPSSLSNAILLSAPKRPSSLLKGDDIHDISSLRPTAPASAPAPSM